LKTYGSACHVILELTNDTSDGIGRRGPSAAAMSNVGANASSLRIVGKEPFSSPP
jgi:hypothetical protein